MKRIRMYKSLIIFVVFTGVTGLYAAELSARLVIRDSVELRHSGSLLLKHILEADQLSPELIDHLSHVELGKMPEPGERIILTNAAISQVLRRHVTAFSNQGSIPIKTSYQIPRQVVVTNISHLLDETEIRQSMVDHWTKLCGQDCEISVAQLNMQKIEAAPGSWRLRLGDDLPRGNFSLPLEVRGSSPQPQIHWLHGRIEVRRRVPVTTRALSFGERVGPKDITWEMRDVTLARDSAPTAEFLIGQRLRSSVGARTIIYSQQVEQPRAVHRGQLTRVIKGDGLWQITSQALAEQDGFVGDRINLRHPQTKTLFSGVVVAEGEVELR